MNLQDIEGSEEDTLAPLASSSIPSAPQMGTWVGQPQPMYVPPGMMTMLPQHVMASSIASGSGVDDPPQYSQVFPQGTFNQFPYFTSQPPALVPNQAMSAHNMSGGSGSNHSGSHKSGTVKTIDPDQVTIRSSDSDRSHSSKGSKRDNLSIADKTSLAYTTDIGSVRNDPSGASCGTSVRNETIPGASCHGSTHGSQSYIVNNAPEPCRLDNMPPNLSASRQSFRMAMGNTSNEFFVDVM